MYREAAVLIFTHYTCSNKSINISQKNTIALLALKQRFEYAPAKADEFFYIS